jgi:hypothetical protein
MTEFQAIIAYARGELDVDGIISGIKDGSIELPKPTPPVDKNSPNWYEEVAEAPSLSPFRSLRVAKNKISVEDEERIRAAVYEAYGAELFPLPQAALDVESPGAADEPTAEAEAEVPPAPEA